MVAEFHLRGWARIPEVEIVALADRDITRAEERRATFAPAAKVYADPVALLAAERLDFVDILTPPALHREHCLLARDSGLHAVCQKPLCPTLAETRALAAAMAESPRLFAVHENHRYRPWFRRVLDRHRAGDFGTPRLVRLWQHDAAEPPEAYKLQAETGVLLEYGTHLIDMLRALLGEPGRIHARLHRLNPRVRGESLAHVAFEYAETTAVVDVAWKPAGPAAGGFMLVGDRGEAIYEGTMTRGDAARLRLVRDGRAEVDEVVVPTAEYVESFYAVEREFTDAVLGRGPLRATAAENLGTLAATFAAYDAASL
jgi:predicted dehydrogenase